MAFFMVSISILSPTTDKTDHIMLNFENVWNLYQKQYHPSRIFAPSPAPHKATKQVNSLLEIADEFDILLLDGFGVLNVGGSSVPHMPEIIKKLQSRGKEAFVLTNGASYPTRIRAEMYPKLGYNIPETHIISSRDAVEAMLPDHPVTQNGGTWAVIVGPNAFIEEMPANTVLLSDDNIDSVDGFIFLATSYWDDAWQAKLHNSLKKNLRPLIIGNPDVSAPLETSFSVEPGFYASELMREIPNLEITFCGKPFQNAYEASFKRIQSVVGDFEPSRVLMVGDTLHTDICGGNEAGCKTLLKADWGFLRGRDPFKFIKESGITPDFVIQNNRE